MKPYHLTYMKIREKKKKNPPIFNQFDSLSENWGEWDEQKLQINKISATEPPSIGK